MSAIFHISVDFPVFLCISKSISLVSILSLILISKTEHTSTTEDITSLDMDRRYPLFDLLFRQHDSIWRPEATI